MAVRYYQELKVWQKAMELSVLVYRLTSSFPSSEIYGLTSQLRRSSVSVFSNIAEGSARSTRDFIRFIKVSFGSLAELESQTMLAQRLDYLTARNGEAVLGLADEIGKMLRGMTASLETKLSGGVQEEIPDMFEHEILATSH